LRQKVFRGGKGGGKIPAKNKEKWY